MNGQYSIGDVVLGNWTLKRLIGEGGFGRVFEAEREDFGRTYRAALKIITIPQTQSEINSVLADGMDEDSVTSYFKSFVEELVNEFSLMSKLKGNSNIVSYEDHTVIRHTNGIGLDILIRMELLTPLLDYARSNALSRKDIMKLGIDMSSALELCQKYNIVHRDIKPENIFVSEYGNFKLGDFGIARTVEKTMSGLSKKGTYTYMAPEIYRSEAYGSSVDIYSLGIVLYRMLNNNRTPFLPDYTTPITHSDREDAIAKRISGAQMPAPKNAYGRLAEIVLKACAYDPKDRYPSPMQIREELEAIIYEKEEREYIYPSGDVVPIAPNDYPDQITPHTGNDAPDMTPGILGNTTVYEESTNTNGTTISTHNEARGYDENGMFSGVSSYNSTMPGMHPATYKKKKKIPLIAILIPAASVIIAVLLIIFFSSNDDAPQKDTIESNASVEGLLPGDNAPDDYLSPDDDGTAAEALPGINTPAAETVLSGSVDNDFSQQSEEPTLYMPYLQGMHYSQARNMLNDLSLDLIIIEDPRASDIEKGYIIVTLPEPGEPLSRGYSVTIIYSSGPEINEEFIPDMVGYTIDQVESAFESLSITPALIYFEDDSPAGTVLYIEKSGQKIEVPATIIVHISSGAPDTPIPSQPDTSIPSPPMIAYSVQVGAYRIYDNAVNTRDSFISGGYDAYITYMSDQGLYKVHIGRYSTSQDAQPMLEHLKSIGNEGAFIIEVEFD